MRRDWRLPGAQKTDRSRFLPSTLAVKRQHGIAKPLSPFEEVGREAFRLPTLEEVLGNNQSSLSHNIISAELRQKFLRKNPFVGRVQEDDIERGLGPQQDGEDSHCVQWINVAHQGESAMLQVLG